MTEIITDVHHIADVVIIAILGILVALFKKSGK